MMEQYFLTYFRLGIAYFLLALALSFVILVIANGVAFVLNKNLVCRRHKEIFLPNLFWKTFGAAALFAFAAVVWFFVYVLQEGSDNAPALLPLILCVYMLADTLFGHFLIFRKDRLPLKNRLLASLITAVLTAPYWLWIVFLKVL